MLLTLGVGLAAVNTGNNLLYLLLGLLLSLLLVSSAISETTLAGLRVERRLPRRAFAGRPFFVELIVHNDKRRRPAWALEMEDVAADGPAPHHAFVVRVDARARVVAGYHRVAARRGWLAFHAVRVRTRFPFGLVQKERVVECPDRLLVYPAPEPALPGRPDEGCHAEALEPVAGDGRAMPSGWLRDYRRGDPARDIHWRRTAAVGHVVVHERDRGDGRVVTLRLDEVRPSGADADWDRAFERAIARAAGAAAELLAKGHGVRVVGRYTASPVVPGGASPEPIWRWLALVEPVAHDEPPAPAARGDAQTGAR